MKTYQYINPEKTIVSVIDEDGVSRSSGSVEMPAFQSWLAAGNTPLPYEPPKTDRRAEILDKLAAIDAKSIRPMRDGDTEFLAKLNEQAKALRSELAKL